MKKYGLLLRVQPQQKKHSKQPIPKPLGFADDDDDDDDDVEREIMRQAYKNKSHKDIEDQHKKVLEEDPSAFDYDGVYDEMKEKQIRPIQQDRQDRKPMYIQALIEKAKAREREHEIIYERKLAKERNQDEDLYADKDKFVTGAYKKKLAEQAKWIEEERLREMREEKEDVTKKTDLSDFYFSLAKNVAFGAGEADSHKLKNQFEVQGRGVSASERVSPQAIESKSGSERVVKSHQVETSEKDLPELKFEETLVKPVSDASIQEQAATSIPSASNQPRPDHHKRSEDALAATNIPSSSNQPRPDHHKRSGDALAAAKERFLARKKAKIP